jgi:hypothetical protein
MFLFYNGGAPLLFLFYYGGARFCSILAVLV